MKRAIDLLTAEHPVVSMLASIALFTLIAALLVVAAFSVVLNGADPGAGHPSSRVIALLLGVTLVTSLMAMILGSFFVVRERKTVADWGAFIAITWLIPYIGISVYLGGSNFAKVWKGRVKSA